MKVQELLGTLKAAGLSLRSVKLAPAGDVIEFSCDEARDTGTVVPVMPVDRSGPAEDDDTGRPSHEALEAFLFSKEQRSKGETS